MLKWSRAFTDLLGIALNLKVAIRALMKLAGGSPAFAHELSVDAFLQQVGGQLRHGCVLGSRVGAEI